MPEVDKSARILTLVPSLACWEQDDPQMPLEKGDFGSKELLRGLLMIPKRYVLVRLWLIGFDPRQG